MVEEAKLTPSCTSPRSSYDSRRYLHCHQDKGEFVANAHWISVIIATQLILFPVLNPLSM